MTETKDHIKSWTYFPIVRKADKTIVSFIETIEDIPCHITMELDQESKVIAKKAIPLNELWA